MKPPRLPMLACLPLLVVLAGCGSEESPAPAKEAEAETVDVVVTLADTVPLDLLSNQDDVVCYVRPESAEVTLRDAAGELVGTETISGEGGEFGGDLCEWEVSFADVKMSDFYEATVKSGEFERKGTSPVDDVGMTRIDVAF